MRIVNGKQYKNGWLVGNFNPAIVKSKDIEIAVHKLKAGDVGKKHYHKKITEYNYIIRGKVVIDDVVLVKDTIFVYEPNEVSNVKFIEDTELLVIKTPSDPTDKYEA